MTQETCPKDETISAYVDQELEEDQTNRIQSHLDTCDSCRQKLEELRSVRSSMGQLIAPETPNSFHNDVQRQIQEETMADTQPMEGFSELEPRPSFDQYRPETEQSPSSNLSSPQKTLRRWISLAAGILIAMGITIPLLMQFPDKQSIKSARQSESPPRDATTQTNPAESDNAPRSVQAKSKQASSVKKDTQKPERRAETRNYAGSGQKEASQNSSGKMSNTAPDPDSSTATRYVTLTGPTKEVNVFLEEIQIYSRAQSTFDLSYTLQEYTQFQNQLKRTNLSYQISKNKPDPNGNTSSRVSETEQDTHTRTVQLDIQIQKSDQKQN